MLIYLITHTANLTDFPIDPIDKCQKDRAREEK